jgi:putative ABC transport system permease protein
MSWFGSIRTATGGVLRHKVQAVVICLVLLVSTASATLGLTLLAASSAPFQHAFSTQHGANLSTTVNPAQVSTADLAATRELRGVTAISGPFPETTAQVQFDGQPYGQFVLAGRASPGGPVDDVVLTAGHWPDGPGQAVLNASAGGSGNPQLGSTLTISGARGAPTLTVTGFASSITNTADGWVAPGEIARLQPAGAPASAQMLYRFAVAGNDSQVRADAAEITKALPSGAVIGVGSWLTAEQAAAGNGSIMEPFVVAFALIGLAMAILIAGNVVSGAVVAGYHRIGVLKSIGLTPAQVVASYLSRVGWPALIGVAAGVVAGNVLAVPVLHGTGGVYGVGHQQVPLWASAAALAGMLLLTALAAFGPALRAGMLSAMQAIAVGQAPRSGSGYFGHRLAARLRLPRPVGLGLAAPLARPARTVVTLVAIAFGTCAVIFAFGLNSALNRAEQGQTHAAAAPVQIQQDGPGSSSRAPSAAQDAAVTAALNAQPGTLRYVAEYDEDVNIPGVPRSVDARAFGGDAAWLDYASITGRWYNAPGEVDANTTFLNASGLAVGDTASVTTGNARYPVRIVGEVFDPSNTPRLYGSAQTLRGVAVTQNLQQYYVGLRPGTDPDTYMQAVNTALGDHSSWQAQAPQGNKFYAIALDLADLLALMVAVAAGLGVLNTVLMTTRDRVHDLGIFKALGMRPGQMLTMVVCWIAGPAIVAAVIAAPAAVLLTSGTVSAMAGTAHTGIPPSFSQVLPPSQLALLSLGALAIAVAGAMLPATWAARATPAAALRTE